VAEAGRLGAPRDQNAVVVGAMRAAGRAQAGAAPEYGLNLLGSPAHIGTARAAARAVAVPGTIAERPRRARAEQRDRDGARRGGERVELLYRLKRFDVQIDVVSRVSEVRSRCRHARDRGGHAHYGRDSAAPRRRCSSRSSDRQGAAIPS
jgi:hypothetical protein